jgi:hypothetical protein
MIPGLGRRIGLTPGALLLDWIGIHIPLPGFEPSLVVNPDAARRGRTVALDRGLLHRGY